MLGAALSWGFGTVLFKRFDWHTPVATVIGWQLLLASIPVGIGALALEPLPDLAGLSTPAIIAFAYVLMFPMVFCQWAYFKIVSMFPAVYAAIGVMAVPVIGVFQPVVAGRTGGLAQDRGTFAGLFSNLHGADPAKVEGLISWPDRQFCMMMGQKSAAVSVYEERR